MHRKSKKLRPLWRLKRKYSRTKVFRESGRGEGTQKITPDTHVWEEDLEKAIKVVPERTKLKSWRLSLKERSTADLIGVLVFINIDFEARNSMQSKAATTVGLLAITHAVP